MGESILIEAPGALSQGDTSPNRLTSTELSSVFFPGALSPGEYLSKSWGNLSLESFYEVSGNPFPGAGRDAFRGTGRDAFRGAGGDTFPGAGGDAFRGAGVRLWVQTMDR